MVIKMQPISGSHGGTAIRYAMEKDSSKGGMKPVFLAANNLTVSTQTGEPNSYIEVLQEMKLRQAMSGHNIKDPFWRIELCPPVEVCSEWDFNDWKEYLDRCIKKMDSTNYREDLVLDKDQMPVEDKDGNLKLKVSGKHTMLANSQYVAYIHFDTKHPHVHLVGNRITEDNQVQDTHKFKVRAKMAADAVAKDMGLDKAEDRMNQRKERIHYSAMHVLDTMEEFDLEKYFDGMRRMGWKVDPRYDSAGICRAYSIGEDIRNRQGEVTSTVMYKASSLGHGKCLTVSNLRETWRKRHPNKVRVEAPKQKPLQTPTQTVRQQPVKPVTETAEERERSSYIAKAKNVLQQLSDGDIFRLTIRHQEDIIAPGIIAKAIEDGGFNASFDSASLTAAGNGLAEMFDGVAGAVASVVGNIALPPDVQVGMGGPGNTSLPKNKDDQWNKWKQFAFGMRPAKGLTR